MESVNCILGLIHNPQGYEQICPQGVDNEKAPTLPKQYGDFTWVSTVANFGPTGKDREGSHKDGAGSLGSGGESRGNFRPIRVCG